MNAKGRDISKYDRTVDFNEFDFYIIRAYDGTGPDPKYRLWQDQCSKPAFPYMFYDFRYRAGPQAIEFWDIVKGDNRPRLAFDVEQWGLNRFPPRLNLLAGLKELTDQLAQLHGMLPIGYMNPAAIKYMMPIPAWLLACPLWIAHWEWKPTLLNNIKFFLKNKRTYKSMFLSAVAALPNYAPWNKWTFWQKQGEPDINEFRGTKDDLLMWLYGGPQPKPWDVSIDAWARTQGYDGPKPE